MGNDARLYEPSAVGLVQRHPGGGLFARHWPREFPPAHVRQSVWSLVLKRHLARCEPSEHLAAQVLGGSRAVDRRIRVLARADAHVLATPERRPRLCLWAHLLV